MHILFVFVTGMECGIKRKSTHTHTHKINKLYKITIEFCMCLMTILHMVFFPLAVAFEMHILMKMFFFVLDKDEKEKTLFHCLPLPHTYTQWHWILPMSRLCHYYNTMCSFAWILYLNACYAWCISQASIRFNVCGKRLISIYEKKKMLFRLTL